MQAVYVAVREAEEFVTVMGMKDVEKRVTQQNLNEGDNRWHPPIGGEVKINVDRAWLKDENRAGAGVVGHNSQGCFCGCKVG